MDDKTIEEDESENLKKICIYTRFLPCRQVHPRAQLRDARLLRQLEFPGKDIAHQRVRDQSVTGLRRS